MRVFSWLMGLSAMAATILPAEFADTTSVSWKKTVIDSAFRSEGAAMADVNKDGQNDILLGEVWYEAPNWKMHEIRKPARDYGDGLKSYSESFACWTDDLNGDDWPDLIVIRFPGAPCFWSANPQGMPIHSALGQRL